MKVPTSQDLSPEAEHEKVLQDLRAIEENSPDANARELASRMRADFSSPEMLAAVRHLSKRERSRARWWNRTPSVRYHDRIIWPWLTVIPCVVLTIATATNVWWVLTGHISISSIRYGAVFGAAALGCYYLYTLRRFSLSWSSEKISSMAMGRRYSHLKTGTIPATSLRDVRERRSDQVLEIYDTSGLAMEVPMQIDGYEHLYRILSTLAERCRRR
jgi:hypothetical protein